MAGTLLRYAKASQDASQSATWSVTGGTEDPGYLATNLAGYDITNPAKLTTTSGIWRADLGSAVALVGVALIHTNLQPGLEVRLQGSNDGAFGTVSANILITIPALRNNWPINPYVIFSTATYRYWRLNVVGTNPVAVSIGHIALLTGVQSFAWAASQIEWVDTIPTWDDATDFEVPQLLDLLTQVRACSFQTTNLDAAQAALDDWWFDARGINKPFVFIPSVEVNECYWMLFQEKTKTVTVDKMIRTLQIKLKEYGRGMLPTPWLV